MSIINIENITLEEAVQFYQTMGFCFRLENNKIKCNIEVR